MAAPLFRSTHGCLGATGRTWARLEFSEAVVRLKPGLSLQIQKIVAYSPKILMGKAQSSDSEKT